MKLIRLGYQWNLNARGFMYHNNLKSLSRRQHGASPGIVIVCVRHNWQRLSWRRCQRRRRCWRYCGSVAAKAKGVQSEIGRATVCIARSFKFPQSERDRHWERQRKRERKSSCWQTETLQRIHKDFGKLVYRRKNQTAPLCRLRAPHRVAFR